MFGVLKCRKKSMDTGLMTSAAATNVEASLASTGVKITTGGGVVSVLAFLSSAQFVAIVGIISAIVGLAITWWYKRRDSLIIRAESEERMRLQKEEIAQRMLIEKERLNMEKEKHQLEMKLLREKQGDK